MVPKQQREDTQADSVIEKATLASRGRSEPGRRLLSASLIPRERAARLATAGRTVSVVRMWGIGPTCFLVPASGEVLGSASTGNLSQIPWASGVRGPAPLRLRTSAELVHASSWHA